jgi:glyoxylase I family protein
MAVVQTTGLHHVRMTVTDLERSKAFYTGILGFSVAAESSGSPEDPATRSYPGQLYGGVVLSTDGMLFGLRPVAAGDDRFDSERVGLDHISFTVGSRDDLDEAERRLEAASVPHGEIQDLPSFGIAILSFQDPDGINLELTAAL